MDALGPRFERFLAVVELAREGRVVACEAITGGYSRISARARVRWRDGLEETFILRGDPPPGSGVFASDRDAEWELLQALPAATSVSTPAARWYDGSGEYLGSKAIVMDCAPAGSLQDEMARAEASAPWPTSSSIPSPPSTGPRSTGCPPGCRTRRTGGLTSTAYWPVTIAWLGSTRAARPSFGT